MAFSTIRTTTEPVINELLCFVSNRVDNTGQDVIVKICCDFYSKAEIEQAKNLLYDLCNERLTEINESRRLITRKGNNKAQADMKDLMDWVLDLGTEIPCFAAVNLSKLPSMGMQHLNLAALVADVAAIKTEMASLRGSQAGSSSTETASNLSEPRLLQFKDDDIRPTTSGGTPTLSNSENVQNDGNSDATALKTVASEAPPAVETAQANTALPILQEERVEPVLPSVEEPAASTNMQEPRSYAELTAAAAYNVPRCDVRQRQAPPQRHQTGRPQQHGRIRDAGIEGSGSGFGSLQAARRSQPRDLTGGLFITQLRPGTHFADVRNHVFRHTGMRLKCLAVRSRNEHYYSSFRIPCNPQELNRLLNPSLWPKDCFVKKFDDHSC
jgi:hypothetical protein